MTEHRGGSGNFAEDKEKASEAGRKGGQNSGGNFKVKCASHFNLSMFGPVNGYSDFLPPPWLFWPPFLPASDAFWGSFLKFPPLFIPRKRLRLVKKVAKTAMVAGENPNSRLLAQTC